MSIKVTYITDSIIIPETMESTFTIYFFFLSSYRHSVFALVRVITKIKRKLDMSKKKRNRFLIKRIFRRNVWKEFDKIRYLFFI